MKIAFVAQPFDFVLPPQQSSIGLVIFNSARQLTDRASVTVYFPRRVGDEQVFEDDHGVVFRSIDTSMDQRLGKVFRHMPIFVNRSRPFDHSAYYFFYMRKIAIDARERHFDIAHILDFSQYARIFKHHNPTTKVALEMHCEWLVHLDRSTIRKRLRYVDLITGCSNYITAGVKAAMPELSVPCHTAYNGIDPDRFHSDTEVDLVCCKSSKVILFVGRVSPEKGVHDLIEAMSEVVRHEPDSKLQIVGPKAALPLEFIVGLSDEKTLRGLSRFYDGSLAADYQEYLERRVKDLKLGEQVEFVGAVPQTELVDRYRASRILVNPSYSESFGMSVAEGMAVGLPVVATAVGGMKELVEVDKTGFLIEQDNPSQLADALLKLLQDDQLSRTMGSCGVERVLKHFSWKKRADILWDHYTSIL